VKISQLKRVKYDRIPTYKRRLSVQERLTVSQSVISPPQATKVEHDGEKHITMYDLPEVAETTERTNYLES
jgi:hypothetical protein